MNIPRISLPELRALRVGDGYVIPKGVERWGGKIIERPEERFEIVEIGEVRNLRDDIWLRPVTAISVVGGRRFPTSRTHFSLTTSAPRSHIEFRAHAGGV